jgi:hypothetical protein
MASFEWPLSKTEIINSALAQTGDNLVVNADDGSVEWTACSPAYERALAYCCEDHPWSWLTDVRLLQPSPTAPHDDWWDTAYPLPSDLVHLIYVRMNDVPCVWDIFNNQLVVNSQGGPPPPSPPTQPLPVTIKGIFSTNADPVNATPAVVLVLQTAVMSGIYRAIRKDLAEAEKMWAAAMQMLAHAKARHDMQKPKTAIFNSRYTAIRRTRKPWRQTPYGWSGTGTPN